MMLKGTEYRVVSHDYSNEFGASIPGPHRIWSHPGAPLARAPTEGFTPTWWCTNPHWQTIVGAFIRGKPKVRLDFYPSSLWICDPFRLFSC